MVSHTALLDHWAIYQLSVLEKASINEEFAVLGVN